MDAARVRVLRQSCAPKSFPCPQCGTPGRRKDIHTRSVRDIAFGQITLIEVTVGEYRAACACCKTFRSHVEGIELRAEYTNRVRDAVIDRLLDDGMSLHRVQQAMRRDFLLDLSDGFLYDYRDYRTATSKGGDFFTFSNVRTRQAADQFALSAPDPTPPAFADAKLGGHSPATSFQVNQGQNLAFSGSVSDNVGLSVITVNVTSPKITDYTVTTQFVSGTSLSLSSYSFDTANTNYAGVSGDYTITLFAKDTSGNLSSLTWNFNVTPAPTASLINGGFESGTTGGWTVTAGGQFPKVVTGGASGNYVLQLGDGGSGLGGGNTASIQQTVAISASAVAPTLSLKYKVEGNDGEQWDWMKVLVNGTQVAKWWADTGGWKTFTYDLSAYKGQSVTVTISSWTADADAPVNYFLDDISIVM